MPEFLKIDGLLLQCGYKASTIRNILAASRRWSDSTLVGRAEAIAHLESLAKSASTRRLVRLKAANILEELRERPPDTLSVTTGDQERQSPRLQVSEDRGRELLRELSALVEIDEDVRLRTSKASNLPALIDITMILTGQCHRRAADRAKTIIRSNFNPTSKRLVTESKSILKERLSGKQQKPTYAPTTLLALLEYVLRTRIRGNLGNASQRKTSDYAALSALVDCIEMQFDTDHRFML
jgi:hypothetical protein